jgi:hypothetical protein
MNKMGRRVSSCAFLLGVVAMVAGCSITGEDDSKPAPAGENKPGTDTPGTPTTPGTPGTDPNDPMAMPPKPAPGMAMVRAIHASPNAPAVDVYAKGSDKPLATNLNYGQTSGWIQVPQGDYEIELRAAPSKPTDPIAYKTGKLNLPDGAMVSAVAAGLLGSTDTDAAFRLLPVVEKFDTVPGGQVRVRAIHAGSDAPSVDLDIGNDDPAKPEAGNIARFADTGQAGVALPAGSSLAIGIAKDSARVTQFTTPKLPAGAQLLVIATGLLAKLPRERDGFSLLAIGPNGAVGFIKQDPIVYALHASPDAPPVDIFVGATEIVGNIQFGQISKPLQVQPGEYQLDFYGATAGTDRPDAKPAAVGNTGQLMAGERYLAEAAGFLAGGSFKLLGYREGFDVKDDKAVLRAVHGSPDAPNVDIGTVANGTINAVLFKDLAFTKSSDDPGLGADQGHIVIGVSATGSVAPVASFTLPAVNGQRAFTVAAGALQPKQGQKSFRLLVVDTAKTPWTVSTLFPH